MPIAKNTQLTKYWKHVIFIPEDREKDNLEYTLIKDINDKNEHAQELGERLAGLLCHVNLIPVNTVEGTGYSKSERERVENFKKVIEEYGLPVYCAQELGSDIAASCGQLRKGWLKVTGWWISGEICAISDKDHPGTK